MKITKILSLSLTFILLISCAISCGSTRSKVQNVFESKGYTVRTDAQSDYPFYSATKEGTLSSFSYVECPDEQTSIGLFESDKQIISADYPENASSTEKSAYGEANGICCMTAVNGKDVIFATFLPENAEEVNTIFKELGFLP